MFKIVKNPNTVKELKGAYVFKAYSRQAKDYMYAKISLKPILGYLLFKIKYHEDF